MVRVNPLAKTAVSEAATEAELRKEVDELKAERKAAQLETELKIAELKAELKAAELKARSEAAEVAESRVADLKAELKAEIKELKAAEVKARRKAAEAAESKVAELKTEINQLKAAELEAQSEIKDLKAVVATMKRQEEPYQSLVQSTASVRCGMAPLLMAVGSERWDVVAFLLESYEATCGPDIIKDDCASVFPAVARAGRLDVVERFIRLGVPVDSVAPGCDPPLIAALENARDDVAFALVKAGASTDAKFDTIDCGVDGLWQGIAAVGDKLFCAPYSASSPVLVIDANTNSVNKISCGKAGCAGYAWRGIAAVGETLYCAPFNASSVLVICAKTETVRRVECGVSGSYKWSGIAAVGNELFCAPYNASSILVLNAETDAVSFLNCGVAGQRKWDGIAAVSDKLFCAPWDAKHVLVIYAKSKAVQLVRCGFEGDFKWLGIAAVDLDVDGFPEYALTSMGDTKLHKLDVETD